MFRCRDYIRVTRMGGVGGVTESCGTRVTQNVEQINNGECISNSMYYWMLIMFFEIGNFEILLRTSSTRRRGGFQATVVCIGQLPSSGGARKRRKRDLEDFVSFIKLICFDNLRT